MTARSAGATASVSDEFEDDDLDELGQPGHAGTNTSVPPQPYPTQGATPAKRSPGMDRDIGTFPKDVPAIRPASRAELSGLTRNRLADKSADKFKSARQATRARGGPRYVGPGSNASARHQPLLATEELAPA